ncbi:hypothetical protein [Thermocoleostomius sinensis]|jgi:hypothetical protein|uniref:Uncharacterized protein n=1 Tax=Thermocoleostomius sinensis A174 TaxID=2016057 RepID=A0A9E9CB59_9CYAN|nr:hypothetical protein [Thermocoleostomius sinensis]WAL61862.1 hypothetical protein OXH18_07735 [Thermocoleostomius sinensis A174]
MSHDQLSANKQLPAPCIVDTGIVVGKQDIQRLLSDLTRVRYCYSQDMTQLAAGEGCILEVFADPQRSTLVANHALYINVCSFDYLELEILPDQQACFRLTQDNCQLQLIPLSNPLQEHTSRNFNIATLEAVIADVLSANWDMQLDDEENFSM